MVSGLSNLVMYVITIPYPDPVALATVESFLTFRDAVVCHVPPPSRGASTDPYAPRFRLEKPDATELERQDILFALYQKLTGPLGGCSAEEKASPEGCPGPVDRANQKRRSDKRC